MQHVEVVRRFPATAQALWDVYTDHANWKEWAGFRRSRLERPGSPERNGSGALRVLGSAGVEVTEEVIDFEPPKRMTYRVVKGGLPMRDHLGEVVFQEDGEGTAVIWRCRFESRVPGLGWPMRLLVTRVFRNALEGLARHAFPGGA